MVIYHARENGTHRENDTLVDVNLPKGRAIGKMKVLLHSASKLKGN